MKSKVEEQKELLMKGVEALISEEALQKKLERAEREGKPLTVKFGLDPSAPDIHLGHAVVLRKLKQFQDCGHQVVIIIGDFTGCIGDPSGKAKGRRALSKEEVKENAVTYVRQIFKVLDREKTQVRFNSEWLEKLNFEEVLRLAGTTTVARMLERDDFANRYRSNIPIGLHEFFYPLMQAYDSVAVKADVELGGTDQTFNILMGRNLQRSLGEEEQAAMFMPILEGLDGTEKMSKSLGNYIGINEEAPVMFKKVMEVPDHLILRYFTLATDEHPNRIRELEEELLGGKNPKEVKLLLAKTITGLYHTGEETKKAEEFYRAAFERREIPEELPKLRLPEGETTLFGLFPVLVSAGFAASGSELRRLAEQGGIKRNGVTEKRPDAKINPGDVLRLGKKKFVKVL